LPKAKKIKDYLFLILIKFLIILLKLIFDKPSAKSFLNKIKTHPKKDESLFYLKNMKLT